MALVQAGHGLSERTACKLLDLERGSYRYEPRPELRSELLKLAWQKPPLWLPAAACAVGPQGPGGEREAGVPAVR